MDSLRKALTRPLSPPPDRLDLEALLRKLGLQKYAPIFAAEEIDTVSCLRLLTEDDFCSDANPSRAASQITRRFAPSVTSEACSQKLVTNNCLCEGHDIGHWAKRIGC